MNKGYVIFLKNKGLIGLIYVLISSTGILGQEYQNHDACGTISTREADTYLMTTLEEREKVVDQYYEQLRTSRASTINIPIQFHISRTDEGENPTFFETDMQDVLEKLNMEFSSIGVNFMTCAPALYVDNSNYHIEFSKDDDEILNASDRPNVLNIYIHIHNV